MKKKIILSFLAILFVIPSMAQLSEGEPNSTTIPRTGNRPRHGNWGMYIGGSVRQVMDLVDAIKDDSYNGWGLPLLNLKYYVTDRWEVRCGFEFASKSSSLTLKQDESENGPLTKAYKQDSQHFARFFPGFAYHFNTKNILDVYMGANMPIGYDTHKSYREGKAEGIKTSERVLDGTFVIGGGVFIGLQCFIADLPLSIGVETGFSGVIRSGGQPKITTNDGTTKQTIYTYQGQNYTLASKTDAEWGADAALIISYYFH